MKPHTRSLLGALADGGFHSGTALARALGVSRGSVWNAVRELEAMGLDIYKVHGRGYRLPQPLSLLEAAAVERHLGEAAARFAIEVPAGLASTNDALLARAAGGAASGAVVAAEWQSAGRGRRGRTWRAAIGGALTFSLLWRFARGAGGLAGLSLAVGVALARSLNALGGRRHVGLKWPNDVVAEGRKLGGILIELTGDVLGPSTAVIGVGLNVRLSRSLRLAIDQPAIDVEELVEGPVDRNALLAGALLELERVLGVFSAQGFAPFRAEWEGYHVHQGRAVTLLLPDGRSERGRASGVAEDGALLIAGRGGPRRFHSGEVSLRPAASPPP
jgi:BirA family biotin operon repressor/biotin-[acetyl-CoA-carboxylase] ligase